MYTKLGLEFEPVGCARTDRQEALSEQSKIEEVVPQQFDGLTGLGEMEVLRSLSNPEEMDDAELLKDLRGLGTPPSFDGKDTMLVSTAVDTRETFILDSSGQKYRKETLPLGEQVLARRPGARVNEHHRAIREMDNQVNQHIEMPQIQHTDKVAVMSVAVQQQVSPRAIETKHRIFKQTVNTCKQQIFKLIDLAHEITGAKVAQKTWHKLLDDASTKGAVADDTANSNTNITVISPRTWRNLLTENEEEIDDQTRSMDSHEIQCENEYGIHPRADTGTLLFPDKIVMERHSLTHFPSQPWCKVQESI